MSTDRRLRALSIAPAARRWLETTQQARVLYAFETVVNLVNDDAQVLSLVSARLGDGPFSIVLEAVDFPQNTHAEAKLLVFENGLWLDDWLIDAEEAPIWQPVPDWHVLHNQPALLASAARQIAALLGQHAPADSLARLVLDPAASSPLPARILQAAEQNIPLLFSSLRENDQAKLREAAKKLAGLGPGLTPAGDDLLLGAMYGLWATRPAAAAQQTAEHIAAIATERTHALSAAWLAAGARGEAAAPWHQLIDAIPAQDAAALQAAVMRILPTGHTSGADALGGFLGILEGWQA
ncbi:MAG: DUF2877 domain-containing protein [Anaerolineales bacterium]|nr:MAG: DUF2877 domain-containing protein [Anaerolineales bacterium]